MIPYIRTPWGNISTFTIMVAMGVISFLGVLHMELKKDCDIDKEEMYIFPKIVYSMLIAYLFAGLFDSVFKIRENKGMVFSGVTFYGGLIGGMLTMFLMMRFSKDKTKYTIEDWFNKLTMPLITFHICGRLGCFLAGCCYGKKTDSIIGVKFPDNMTGNILHYGNKCFPTQLFEVGALIIIILFVKKAKSKCITYLILYAISRFIIEFFRGDNRGIIIDFLSPAQTISVVILTIICIQKLVNKKMSQ